jgi:sugar phosphate isomerase/epimerase
MMLGQDPAYVASNEISQASVMMKNRVAGRLGLVSNCWKVQLDGGASLRELVAQAANEGFRFVELRQGCLGECEDSKSRLPLADRLNSLAEHFPEITFDLAVELPVFSESIDVSSATVNGMLQSVKALSAHGHPAHLRIVDPFSKMVPIRQTADDEAESCFCLQDVVDSLSNLRTELPTGIVSVEHSFQPWAGFRTLFDVANSSECNVRVCYDPCNLWLAGDGEAADEITASLPVDWLSMVHLKQRVDSSVSTRLEPGDVDWSRQLNLLNDARYAGPFLFETTPSEDAWECLRDSRDYFVSIVRKL